MLVSDGKDGKAHSCGTTLRENGKAAILLKKSQVLSRLVQYQNHEINYKPIFFGSSLLYWSTLKNLIMKRF